MQERNVLWILAISVPTYNFPLTGSQFSNSTTIFCQAVQQFSVKCSTGFHWTVFLALLFVAWNCRKYWGPPKKWNGKALKRVERTFFSHQLTRWAHADQGELENRAWNLHSWSPIYFCIDEPSRANLNQPGASQLGSSSGIFRALCANLELTLIRLCTASNFTQFSREFHSTFKRILHKFSGNFTQLSGKFYKILKKFSADFHEFLKRISFNF